MALPVALLLATPWAARGQDVDADQAGALLRQGVEMFDALQYAEAQKVLLEAAKLVDAKPAALSKDDTDKLNDYLRKVHTAVREQRKAREALRTAETAERDGDFAAAEQFLSSAAQSPHLTAAERKDAAARLEVVREKAKIAAAAAPAPAAPSPPAVVVPVAVTEPEAAAPSPEATVEAPAPAPAPVPTAPAPPAPEVAAPTAPEAPAPVDTAALEKLEAQRSAKAKELLDEAKKAMDANDFAKAVELLDRVLVLAPQDAEALSLFAAARDRVGRPAEDATLTRLEVVQRVSWQMACVDIDKKMRESLERLAAAARASDFDDAAALAQAAKRVLEANKTVAPSEEYRERLSRIDQHVNRIAVMKREWEEVQADSLRKKAEEDERRRREQAAADLSRQIRNYEERARRLRDEQKFPEALEIVTKLLSLQSDNRWALEQRDILQQFVILSDRKLNDRLQREEEQKVMADVESKMIPWFNELQYPRIWEDIRKRADKYGAVTTGESEATRMTRQKLQRVLESVDFEDIAFREVLEFLRNYSGCNFFVNWKAVNLMGIDRNTPVTAHLQKVTVEKALEIILRDVGGTNPLQYVIEEGVVMISTKDDLARQVFTRAYDIRHLLFRVPNFVGPRMDFANVGQANANNQGVNWGAWAAQNVNNQAGEDNLKTRSEMIQDLIDRIKRHIDPSSWMTEASIDEYQGQLIVTQTAKNHQDLARLLNQLREAQGMQVSIEARFIQVSTGFLNSIGIDLDVYFNLGSTLNPPYTTDPFTGAQVPGPANPSGWTTAGHTVPGNSRFTPMGAAMGGPARTARFGNMMGVAGTGVPAPIGTAIASPGLSISGIFLDDIQVDFLLEATQAHQATRLLNAPRITVWNGQRSYVSVSTQQAYISGYDVAPPAEGGTPIPVPQISFAPSGATLDVEATVSDDRKYVILTIRPQVAATSSIVNQVTPAGTVGLPIISVQDLQTTVMVPDGGTLLLGGTTQAGEIEHELGIPLLSKIAILNRLTTTRGKVRDQYVLLVLVRPKIIIHDEEENKQFPP